MATVNEEIVTGRKFRKLIDEATKLWQRISFWTKASDVEFDDGQTAENKMGAISGITSDLNGESENVAASIKAVNELNNKLMYMTDNDTIKGLDAREDGVYITYVPANGADPVSKKLGDMDFTLSTTLVPEWVDSSNNIRYTITIKVDFAYNNGVLSHNVKELTYRVNNYSAQKCTVSKSITIS